MTTRVLATITREDIQAHRARLSAWAVANGLDPTRIAETLITVEQVSGRTVICYQELQRDARGRLILDPAGHAEALTVRRAVDQRVSLEAAGFLLADAGPSESAGAEVTQGDADCDHPGG
ncbi:hypothetical protein [Streptomyces sp. NPDC055036]